jgi:DNA repair exonuclease SbcCD ATPase subunit
MMNEATKRFARVHAPWLLQKYHAAQKYLESIRKYFRFAPNKHKQQLRKELERTENELREIEQDIQDRIDKQYKEKEVRAVKAKYGEKAAKVTEEIRDIQHEQQQHRKKYREKKDEKKRRREEKMKRKELKRKQKKLLKEISKAQIPLPVNLEEIQRKILSELPPPPAPLQLELLSDWEELEESYKEVIKAFRIKFKDSVTYFIDLEFAKGEIIKKFKEFWKKNKMPTKFNILYVCDFRNIKTDEISKQSFGSYRNAVITSENQIESVIERAINNILNSLRGIRENTEWVWYSSKYINLNLFRYNIWRPGGKSHSGVSLRGRP